MYIFTYYTHTHTYTGIEYKHPLYYIHIISYKQHISISINLIEIIHEEIIKTTNTIYTSILNIYIILFK